MSRQILKIHTNKTLEESKDLLNSYFEANGYSINRKGMLVRENLAGITFYQVYFREGIIKIEGWIKVINGKELGVDNELFGAAAKTALAENLKKITSNFEGYEIENYNSSTKLDEDNDGYVLQEFILKSDFKHLAMISLIASLLILVIPLPRIVILIALIGTFIFGIKGLNSSKKWMAIAGITLSILDMVVLIINILDFIRSIN